MIRVGDPKLTRANEPKGCVLEAEQKSAVERDFPLDATPAGAKSVEVATGTGLQVWRNFGYIGSREPSKS
jgi:hypothetical protein